MFIGKILLLTIVINQNFQCFIIAGAFLVHEDSDSFKFVFKSFKEDYKSPNLIFTDEDKAITKAIREEFNEKNHKL